MLFNEDMRTYIKKTTEKFGLIIMDPPFGKVVNANWDAETFELNNVVISDLYNILEDDGNLLLHCGMGSRSNSLIEWFNAFEQYNKTTKKDQFQFQDTITWAKTRGIGMRRGPLQISEHILWFTKKGHRHNWNTENQYSEEKRPFNVVKKGGQMVNKSEYKRFTTVWDIPELGFGKSPKMLKEVKKDIAHLTPKHPKLADRMIKLFLKQGSSVYIPFAGSGMELLACKENYVKWIATEIDVDNINFISNYILSDRIKFEDF